MLELEKGKYIKNGGYTKTTPRKWTSDEIEYVKQAICEGKTYKEIAELLDRSETSVSIKAKRIGKKQNTYNSSHVEEKYNLNKEFLETIKPKTILDCYCGVKSFYKELGAVTNDIDKNIEAMYHTDAFKLLCKMYIDNESFDLIDLDPFGSAYDCFDLAIKMAKKGLAITLGELGHKRWKRLDFVERYYDIKSLEEFNIDNLIEHIQQIGLRNKKTLTVYKKVEWKNTGRVYFTIEPCKITKQWD